MHVDGVNQVLLPWPPKVLSPNARAHWRARAAAAKSYRMQCFIYAKRAALTAPAGQILLTLEFLPPNARRRDDDNLVGAFKSGRDGLADALGIDDSRFVTLIKLGQQVHAGGAVRVSLQPFPMEAG